MKFIEELRIKIALKLLQTKGMTATAHALSQRAHKTRCVHCGKNPYFKELEEG